MLKNINKPFYVTICGSGSNLGGYNLAETDKFLTLEIALENIAVLLGGTAFEKHYIGNYSVGNTSDISQIYRVHKVIIDSELMPLNGVKSFVIKQLEIKQNFIHRCSRIILPIIENIIKENDLIIRQITTELLHRKILYLEDILTTISKEKQSSIEIDVGHFFKLKKSAYSVCQHNGCISCSEK